MRAVTKGIETIKLNNPTQTAPPIFATSGQLPNNVAANKNSNAAPSEIGK